MKSGDFTDEFAFSENALKATGWEWHQTWSYGYSHLQHVSIPVSAMRIGACASETNWSIRGWMQEKRYSSRSLALVDSLVRLHSNLVLEPRMQAFEACTVPWDADCKIAEPPSDEPARRRSRRISGDEPDADEAAPRRVFIDETDQNDEDPFGDPEADLIPPDSDMDED